MHADGSSDHNLVERGDAKFLGRAAGQDRELVQREVVLVVAVYIVNMLAWQARSRNFATGLIN